MAEEKSRVDAERVQKEERQRAEVSERESRVRIRQQEEALAAARERDRLVEEERRRREEEARLDGIRRAEVERVRGEAAHKAAHETALVQRKHELELAAIRQAESARTTRGALVATGALSLALVALLAWRELGAHPEQLASLQAVHEKALDAERTRATRAENELTKSEARRRELEREHAALVAAVPPAPSVDPSVRPGPSGQRGGTPYRPQPSTKPKPGKPGVCVDDGDPMNPCLSGSRLR